METNLTNPKMLNVKTSRGAKSRSNAVSTKALPKCSRNDLTVYVSIWGVNMSLITGRLMESN